MLLDQIAVRIHSANGSQCSGSGKHCVYLVFLNHPPKDSRIRSSDRLAFIDDCRVSSNEGTIYDIRLKKVCRQFAVTVHCLTTNMTHNPANVTTGEVHVAFLCTHEGVHGKAHCSTISSCVSDDPFRRPC